MVRDILAPPHSVSTQRQLGSTSRSCAVGEMDPSFRWGDSGVGVSAEHTKPPASPRASGDLKRTTAEQSPSLVRYRELIRNSRLELGSAVVTGILGVHRECPGRLLSAPPPQTIVLTKPRSSRFPSPIPFGDRKHTLASGSKLRRQATWTCRTFPAWPGPNRRSNHPASLPQLLVCNLACGAAMWGV